jgi:hypothetical protein
MKYPQGLPKTAFGRPQLSASCEAEAMSSGAEKNMKTAFGLGIVVGITGLLTLQHFPVLAQVFLGRVFLARVFSGPPSAPPNIRSDAAYPAFCPPPDFLCK